MKERPILFSGLMVLAILEGLKTQTRRVIKPEWYRCLDFDEPEDIKKALGQCPYGKPGDHLWVRETWAETGTDLITYRADNITRQVPQLLKWKTSSWKPSIFMLRWASRITLEITGVRVERVQDITVDDARAEGCAGKPLPGQLSSRNDGYAVIKEFEYIWEAIIAKHGYGWDANPWVWVIEFKKVCS